MFLDGNPWCCISETLLPGSTYDARTMSYNHSTQFGTFSRSYLAAGMALLACFAAGSASAAPVIYDSQSAFDSAVAGFAVQGFETPIAGGATVTLPGFTISESSANPGLNQGFAPTMATDGNCSIEYRSDGPSTVRFTFSEPQTAFGVSIISFGNTGNGYLSVTDNSGVTSTLMLATSPPQLDPLNTIFYGIESLDAPFTQIEFFTTSADDLIAFDGVRSLAASEVVPEPTSLTLGVLGVAWMASAAIRAGLSRRKDSAR